MGGKIERERERQRQKGNQFECCPGLPSSVSTVPRIPDNSGIPGKQWVMCVRIVTHHMYVCIYWVLGGVMCFYRSIIVMATGTMSMLCPWCPKGISPGYRHLRIGGLSMISCPWDPKVLGIIPGYPHLHIEGNSMISCPCDPKVLGIIPGYPWISHLHNYIEGHSMIPCPWDPKVLGIIPGYPWISPPSYNYRRAQYDPMSVGSQSPRYYPRISQDIPTFIYKRAQYDPMSVGSQSPRYYPRISPPSYIEGHSMIPCPWNPKVLGIIPGYPKISL